MTISDYSGLFGFYGNDMTSGLFGGGAQNGGVWGSSVLYKGFSEVNSIGYRHLLKNYVARLEETEEEEDTGKRKPLSEKLESLKQETVKKANAEAEAALKSDACSLLSSSDNLTAVDESDKNILFSKAADTIRSAVKTFVKEYNDLIETVEGGSYKNNRMESLKNQLVSLSKANQFQLEKVGISVGRNGAMTIDENSFASADLGKLEDIFGSSQSFAARAGEKAKYVSERAAHYTNDSYGAYTSNLNYKSLSGTGNLFNNFF